jgi:hypothetical protein
MRTTTLGRPDMTSRFYKNAFRPHSESSPTESNSKKIKNKRQQLHAQEFPRHCWHRLASLVRTHAQIHASTPSHKHASSHTHTRTHTKKRTQRTYTHAHADADANACTRAQNASAEPKLSQRGQRKADTKRMLLVAKESIGRLLGENQGSQRSGRSSRRQYGGKAREKRKKTQTNGKHATLCVWY